MGLLLADSQDHGEALHVFYVTHSLGPTVGAEPESNACFPVNGWKTNFPRLLARKSIVTESLTS